MTRRHDETIPSRERLQEQQRFRWVAMAPFLLIVLLMVVEAGRILYTWTRLQDVALRGARYASSGAYDADRYPVDEVVPCVSGDERGTRQSYDPNGARVEGDEVNVYAGGVESVFSTWYGGLDCTPGDPIDEALRVDMVRLLSVMSYARSEAAGLMITSGGIRPPPYGENLANQPWYGIWDRPQLREYQVGWFNVVVCSSRPALNLRNRDRQAAGSRFTTYVDRLGFSSHPEAPICVLSETDVGENVGKPWLDAGGPGDLVTVVVQYNHPLLLSLGVGREAYVRLETYASLTNAAFRPEQLATLTPTQAPEALTSETPPPTFTVTPSATPRILRVTQPPGTAASELQPTATASAPTLYPRDCADGC